MFGRRIRNRTSGSPAGCLPLPQTDELLVEEKAGPQPPEDPEQRLERLDQGLHYLSEFTRDRFVPTSLVVNPLLSVWGTAHEIDSEVSGPVEALLTVAMHRATLEADELLHFIDEVRAEALQHTVLAELVDR